MDYKEDLILIKYILNKLDYHNQFRYRDIIQLYKKNQKFFEVNSKNFRNQKKNETNKGQSLWSLSKRYIAGGNMLFRKDQIVFCQKNGRHTLNKLQAAKLEI